MNSFSLSISIPLPLCLSRQAAGQEERLAGGAKTSTTGPVDCPNAIDCHQPPAHTLNTANVTGKFNRARPFELDRVRPDEDERETHQDGLIWKVALAAAFVDVPPNQCSINQHV